MRRASRRQTADGCQVGTPCVNRLFGSVAGSNPLPTRIHNSSATGVFGAEEAVGWAVSRLMIEPGQGPPRSQPETQAPLRPDAIDRTVRLTARAPPPLSTENAGRRAGDPLARL
ncbi:MAG TPA: hypothetical protein VGY54_08630 [Polyangiaceae bacterium]|nr:hypothetical protein [Polyangiaceae bacterium]